MKNYPILKLIILFIIIYLLGYFLIGKTSLISTSIKNFIPDRIKSFLKSTVYKNKYEKLKINEERFLNKIVTSEILAGHNDFEENFNGEINDTIFTLESFYIPRATPYISRKNKSKLLLDDNNFWVILKSGKILKIKKDNINKKIIPFEEIKTNLYQNFFDKNSEKILQDGIVGADLSNDKFWLLISNTHKNCQKITILSSNKNNQMLNFIKHKEIELNCGLVAGKFYLKIFENKIFLHLENSIYLFDIESKKMIKKIDYDSIKEVVNSNQYSVDFINNNSEIYNFDLKNFDLLKLGKIPNVKNLNQYENINSFIVEENIFKLLEITDTDYSIVESINLSDLHNEFNISSVIKINNDSFLISTFENMRLMKLTFKLN